MRRFPSDAFFSDVSPRLSPRLDLLSVAPIVYGHHLTPADGSGVVEFIASQTLPACWDEDVGILGIEVGIWSRNANG